jgi:hypothetical protein
MDRVAGELAADDAQLVALVNTPACRLRRDRSKPIVMIDSPSAHLPLPFYRPYSASKVAIGGDRDYPPQGPRPGWGLH